MKKRKTVLILGSGGLRIGQAGEFDYSGSQAIKALKEENISTILINPNIATVQTDQDMADTLYLQPLNLDTVTRIIEKEKPDGILLGFGGQTALNLGIELDKNKVLEKHKVTILGTPVEAIRLSEDRDLFKKALKKIDVDTPKSYVCTTVVQAVKAAKSLNYPVMIRSGYSLGGQGAGKIASEKVLKEKVNETLQAVPQILVEEYLLGWKEVEYEIVRDIDGNIINVCNMENFDPMGIHTGESIVVAPSQTLNDQEYQMLREIAFKVVQHLGIIGECNVQYAFCANTGSYRVIELNARLSRSSALASKATGYPLAFVATKLALGKRLWEITNSVTGKTTAFFEPSLDYLVVKMPRWDTPKLKAAERTIGSEMKSIGEVMAIGRSFPEALQKAIRMLNIGTDALDSYPQTIADPKKEIEKATDRRLFAIYQYLNAGNSVDDVHQLSKINKWFLDHIQTLCKMTKTLSKEPLTKSLLHEAKALGFCDKAIAGYKNTGEESIRNKRKQYKILPFIKQIDTLAGEFPAQTNYLYTTYHANFHDIKPQKPSPIMIIGSGPYCIGSSVEFDWCAVNTARSLKKMGKKTILINSNPETVSTDYDESDRLYFEELTAERIRDILDFEKTQGTIISVGGQIANNLALLLHKHGYKIIGTHPQNIDKAENRQTFSSLLNKLHIDQPLWEEVKTITQAKKFVKKVGYPILVRPSYVLSGAAMNVITDEELLNTHLKEALLISKEHPVVMSRFIQKAKEIEIDGVAQNGQIIIQAITEHIENAGVHSGDATLVLPPQRLFLETITRVKKITGQIVEALEITGPFNLQFIAKNNEIKVIECNVRASRSFPFVSKVSGKNFIDISTKILMNKHKKTNYQTLEMDYVGVKTSQFSYNRLKGANPVAHVEMASTGEVACIGDNYLEAFYASWLATEQKIKGKSILVSIGGDRKKRLLKAIIKLAEAGWEIYSTEGTYDYLTRHGVPSLFVFKKGTGMEPNVSTLIHDGEVDLIVNIPRHSKYTTKTEGYQIRRMAIDHHIPLITNLQIAHLFLTALTSLDSKTLPIRSRQDYLSLV